MNNYPGQMEAEFLLPDTFEHGTFPKTTHDDHDRHQAQQ
jgi:hypothetical protein